MCMGRPKTPAPPDIPPPPIPPPPPAKPATFVTPRATGAVGNALRRQGKKALLIPSSGTGNNTPGY